MPRGLALAALFLCAAGVFAPAAVFFAKPAQADFADEGAPPPAFLSAADLARFCASAYDTDYGFCAGFITAVAEQLKQGPVMDMRACRFGAARSQQFVDLFRAYAKNYPAALAAPAQQATAAALARAFPCSP